MWYNVDLIEYGDKYRHEVMVNCRLMLDKCLRLAGSDSTKDKIELSKVIYNGPKNLLRIVLCEDKYVCLLKGVNIGKVSDSALYKIGEFISGISGKPHGKTSSNSWGRYNSYVELLLTPISRRDGEFIYNMSMIRHKILSDLLHAFVYPAYGIINMFNFTSDVNTKGGGINIRAIMNTYAKEDANVGYTILRKMFVKRLRMNLDRVQRKYINMYVNDTRVNIILSYRDIEDLYNTFISILVEANWDYHIVKKVGKTLEFNNIKLSSLNTEYNTYTSSDGNVVSSIIDVDKKVSIITLFDRAKYKFSMTSHYPCDVKLIKLDAYYKKCIIKINLTDDTVHMKLFRYSNSIETAGYSDIDCDDCDMRIVDNDNIINNSIDIQTDTARNILFDSIYSLISDCTNNHKYTQELDYEVLVTNFRRALRVIFTDTYHTKVYKGDGTPTNMLYVLRQVCKSHVINVAKSNTTISDKLEQMVTSLLLAIDGDDCEAYHCTITKDGLLLSGSCLHDLWLTYLEEKHKGK